MEKGIIRVWRQVSRIDGEIVEAPLKTMNSYHAATISPHAVEVLKAQKEAVQTMENVLAIK